MLRILAAVLALAIAAPASAQSCNPACCAVFGNVGLTQQATPSAVIFPPFSQIFLSQVNASAGFSSPMYGVAVPAQTAIIEWSACGREDMGCAGDTDADGTVDRFYLMLGSLGNNPGTPLCGSCVVPLNYDSYTIALLQTGAIQNGVGPITVTPCAPPLAPSGPFLLIPAANVSALIGTTLYHGFVIFGADPISGALYDVGTSNAGAMMFAP